MPQNKTREAPPQTAQKNRTARLRLARGYVVLPRSAGRDILKASELESVALTSAFTMSRTLSRREALGLLGVAGAALSSACSGESPTSPTTTTTTTTTTSPGTTTTPPVTSTGTCVVSPNETIGPYPSLADFTRSDIRETKQGLPLTLDHQRRQHEQLLRARERGRR